MVDSSVLVIGAGISGLSAAEHLFQNGFTNITVLEGASRPGGRMHTVPFGGTGQEIVELGANWIHGTALNNPIFMLASKNKLLEPYVLLDRMEGYCYDEDGVAMPQELSRSFWQLFMQWEDDMVDYAMRTREDGSTINLQEYFSRRLEEALQTRFPVKDHDSIRKLFNCCINYARVHFGNNLEDRPIVSAPKGKPKKYGIPGGNVKVPSGMKSLIYALINDLPPGIVKYGEDVIKIDWSAEDGKVKVLCRNGHTYTAMHVIVTVSLGVLKKQHTTLFIPSLSKNKIQAISNIGFGRVGKIFLHFKEQFWTTGSGSIKFAWSDAEVYKNEREWYKHIFCFDEVLNNPGTLIGWISGPSVEVMESLTEEEIGHTCTQLLRRFLINPSIPLPDKVIRSQWCSNPFTQGSWSYWNHTTTIEDVQCLAQPLKDVSGRMLVQFAGEATGPIQNAGMHDGRFAGLREAQSLIDYYKPQAKL